MWIDRLSKAVLGSKTVLPMFRCMFLAVLEGLMRGQLLAWLDTLITRRAQEGTVDFSLHQDTLGL